MGKLQKYNDATAVEEALDKGKAAHEALGGHTIGADVPEGAKFTDTIYDDTAVKADILSVSKKTATLETNIGGHTVKSDVPENAVFTDTVYDDTEVKKDISKITSEYEKNPLFGKKVSFLGDSICAGSDAEGRYLGGYGKIIADRNSMIYENVARGGATVTANTYTREGEAKTWLCRIVETMSDDADYAIIEGGINDAWHWQALGLEIGSISDGYNAVLDDTTYYGAFESMLKQLVTRFKGKKIGYIAVPKIMDLYDSERNVPNFYHIALECCAKWGVSVCDLNTIIPPTEYLSTLTDEYTTDGVHPTYEGYLKYYCDPIEAWMKTLMTSNTAMTAQKIVESYMQGVNDAIEALQTGKLSNVGVSFRRAKLPLADGTTIEIDVLTAVDGNVIIPYTNRVPISIDTDGSIFNGTGYMEGYRLSSSGATKEHEYSTVTGFISASDGDVIRINGCDWASNKNALNYICAYDAEFNYIGHACTVSGSDSLTIKSGVVTNYQKDDALNATMTLSGATIAYIRVSSNGTGSGCDGSKMIITVNEEIS